MEQLIEVNRNSIFLILFITLNACSANKSLKNNKKIINISFSSIYNDEKLSLNINDSSYYVNQRIKTDRSLGIDMKNYLTINGERVHLKGTFVAKIIPDFDKNYIRELKIDTILNRDNGDNILIQARKKSYIIKQQSKLFKVE